MSQVTGIVKLYVDGDLKRSKPGASISVGGKKREAVSGHSVYGFVEEVVESEIECTIAHMSDDDAVAMSNLTNVTVTFEADTGQKYTVKDAWTSEPCKVQSGGDMSLKMKGPPAVLE